MGKDALVLQGDVTCRYLQTVLEHEAALGHVQVTRYVDSP